MNTILSPHSFFIIHVADGRGTPIIVARITAVVARHTAMVWAEMLDGPGPVEA